MIVVEVTTKLKEKWKILAILAVASVLRLAFLDRAPLYFDEAVHSVIVNNMLRFNYHYDPAYHGPLLYRLIAPAVIYLGLSEISLRLVPAIFGILTVYVVYSYREFISEETAILASLFVAICPAIVNYSRFCRADSFQLFFVAVFVYYFFKYLKYENRWNDFSFDESSKYLLYASFSMALFACTKETFYVYAVIFGAYVLTQIKNIRLTDLALSVAVFFFVYLTVYSNYWSDLSIFSLSNFPAVRAVEYWKYQHDIARIAGPWYYYLEIIIVYALPLLLFAIAKVEGMIIDLYKHGKRLPEPKLMIFTAYWFISVLVFHSYMQEKVPWLVVHILLPMYILSAQMINEMGEKAKKVAIVICVALLLYGTIHANFIDPTNPAEPILYMPTTWEAREFANSVNDTYVVFMTTPGEYYPLIWYFNGKHLIVTKDVNKIRDVEKMARISNASYVVLANSTIAEKLIDRGYIPERELVVRCWSWWTYPQVEKLPEFLVFRKPFGNVYCMNFTVFRG
ncbi:MAG: flippase activity-associated protein Agl23 [Methermicoccaceae archaeon]